MTDSEREPLRVLIANERSDNLDRLAPILVGLGHEVIAREVEVDDVAAATARQRPDVAFVALGQASEHALDLIDQIVGEAACPVIAVIPSRDPQFRQGGIQTRGLRLHQ